MMPTLEALGKDFAPLAVKLAAGTIDWTTGQLVATGSAAARKEALRQAAANMLSLMGELEAGPSGFFLDRYGGGPTVESLLSDFAGDAEDVEAKAGRTTVRLRVPIHGLRSAVFARQVYYSGWPQWDIPRPRSGAAKFEAVVFDARETGFAPVIYPRVTLGGGACIFDGFFLRRDAPGPAARPLYVTHSPRAPAATKPAALPPALALTGGGRGLVLRAVVPSGRAGRGSLVLHDDDAPRLADCANAEKLLQAGDVVIVADVPG